MKVRIKKLHENAVLPKFGKVGDAGADLTATSYEYVNGRHCYGTGLALEIPEGHVGLIFPRSSICNKDLRLSNCVGVIDENFRGEVKFFFEDKGMNAMNPSQPNTNIYKIGDRIGQLIIMPYPKPEYIEADELSETNRGSQGFGSSGS